MAVERQQDTETKFSPSPPAEIVDIHKLVIERQILESFPELDSELVEVIKKSRFPIIPAVVKREQIVSPILKQKEEEKKPLFEERTLLIDMSRGGIYTPDFLKHIIETCASFQINTITLYTEFFEVDDHPKIGNHEQTGQLKKTEIKKLVEYADTLGVTLYPSIQTLGHLEKILRQEEYKKFSFPGKFSASFSTLNPSAPGAYEFIETLIANAIEPYQLLGKTPKINIGCDETYDITNNEYVTHIQKIHEIGKKYDLDMYMWGDRLIHLTEEQIEQLPKDIKKILWIYDETDFLKIDTIIAEHAKQGITFDSVCSSTASHNQVYPFSERAKKNTDSLLQAGAKWNIPNAMIAVWHDDSAEAPFAGAWDSIAYFAGKSFSGKREDPDMLLEKIGNRDINHYATASTLPVLTENHVESSISPLIPNPIKQLIFSDIRTLNLPNEEQEKYCRHFDTIKLELQKIIGTTSDNEELFTYTYAIADYLSSKLELSRKMRDGYELSKKGNPLEFYLLQEKVKETVQKLIVVWLAHRKLWLSEKKPHGFENVEQRYIEVVKDTIALYGDVRNYSYSGEKIPYLETGNNTTSSLLSSVVSYKDIRKYATNNPA